MSAALDEALAHWGGSAEVPRLISHRENAVYDVVLSAGRAALRLHRPGYRSEAEIAAELVWTEALTAAGFAAPGPVRALDGGLVARLGSGQLASVIAWMDGAPIGSGLQPLPGSAADQAALYHEVGGLLAQLHNVTDALDLPDGFVRPLWDRDGLTGAEPVLAGAGLVGGRGRGDRRGTGPGAGGSGGIRRRGGLRFDPFGRVA